MDQLRGNISFEFNCFRDLPMQKIAEFFNVNHFIVSQGMNDFESI